MQIQKYSTTAETYQISLPQVQKIRSVSQVLNRTGEPLPAGMNWAEENINRMIVFSEKSYKGWFSLKNRYGKRKILFTLFSLHHHFFGEIITKMNFWFKSHIKIRSLVVHWFFCLNNKWMGNFLHFFPLFCLFVIFGLFHHFLGKESL